MKVHVYSVIYTRDQVYGVLERLSGEKVPREYISEDEINTRIEKARVALNQNPEDISALTTFTVSQLFRSWGMRGENTPEYAVYLGYLSDKDLYPDFAPISDSRTMLGRFLKGRLEESTRPRNNGMFLKWQQYCCFQC
ncbi:hypothetical protein ASPSYDRAFT_391773 [Aspergillus sydowii CBS 593.65]|uniref:NmrA-like domain-containing protein n=1 Tax=Aspergillus sydowii CBS 593.65 TaxID=1036612 RepID=A0A1L9T956_9EURO|nr:uncharacterized protein ASPSYDRAFT_391773 [Aspergillus sydowii CBS 593.65]OJJ55921.1 hypothetical protein ASPSYDRAFT_391773 [Aspergillus sydowii CBS 593.65]